MIPTKFQFIWESGFRGEDFLEINQSETRMACGSHVGFPISTKNTNLVYNHPMNISAKFGSNLFVVSEKKMKMWNSHRVQC